ncbi:MAG: hypothetical protein WCN98_19445 [Verrucomicrobiaceae bacterium]
MQWGPLRDGYDVCEWLATQPWCTGKVHTPHSQAPMRVRGGCGARGAEAELLASLATHELSGNFRYH